MPSQIYYNNGNQSTYAVVSGTDAQGNPVRHWTVVNPTQYLTTGLPFLSVYSTANQAYTHFGLPTNPSPNLFTPETDTPELTGDKTGPL